MSGVGGLLSVNVVQNDFVAGHPLPAASPAGLKEGRCLPSSSHPDPSRVEVASCAMAGPAHPPAPVPIAGSGSSSSAADVDRQKQLTQQLQDVGILPVYDPVPSSRGPGPTSIFDLRQFSGDRRTFLLSPAPKGFTVECKITRERSALNSFNPRYVVETEQGDFLMGSKKRNMKKTSNYVISMTKAEAPKGSDNHLGKLRSNFLGSEFVAYGPGLNPAELDKGAPLSAVESVREELAAISYTSTLWGKKPRGPRKMEVFLPFVNQRGERIMCKPLIEEEGLLATGRAGGQERVDSFQNKSPKWNDQIGAFVLNFNKRVTQASVKNFQLVSTDDSDTVYLQFGRVAKDSFTMDFRWPLSAFQAFAICLSSFDYKLCCE